MNHHQKIPWDSFIAPSWIPRSFSSAILSDGLWMFGPLHTQLASPWWPGQTVHYIGMFDLNQQPIVLQDIVPDVLGFLEVLQDMSSFNPSSRVSASAAPNRLKRLRSETPPPRRCHKSDRLNYLVEVSAILCSRLSLLAGHCGWPAKLWAWAVPPCFSHVFFFLKTNLTRFRVSSKKTDWKFFEHQYTLVVS